MSTDPSCQKLVEALELAREYFDDRCDVNDGPYGEPVANKEMALVQMIDVALGAQPRLVEQQRENAAFIVKCVNAHAQLVAALEDAREFASSDMSLQASALLERIDAALDQVPA